MITLDDDKLVVRFPDVFDQARLEISFARTLRIPDDGHDHPLPAGLGRFPVRHVDDFGDRVPKSWRKRGGVMIPMHRSEAMWICFESDAIHRRDTAYPFAVKVGAGKINAMSGLPWQNGLNPKPQDYVVAPDQPWLDGFNVGKEVIRQFVATPLGSGESVEEQLTGMAEHGGVQLAVCPMRFDEFDRRWPQQPEVHYERSLACPSPMPSMKKKMGMGLAAGGLIRQEIYRDPYSIDAWQQSAMSRCFVHLCDAATWKHITGEDPPTDPITARQYKKHGIPWFEHYNEELGAVEGSKRLKTVKPVTAALGEASYWDRLEGSVKLTRGQISR
ncbi:MAG: hypothetical protein RIG82_05795 [Phycisphaeraceae bacterium]